MRAYEDHLEAVRLACSPPSRPAPATDLPPTTGIHQSTDERPTTETLPLKSAAGRALSQQVTAAFDSPRFDNSQMDGYALPLASGGQFTVGQDIPAGQVPAPLITDESQPPIAVPIMTGAMVPDGTVAIVPVEKCQPPEFPQEGATIQVPEVTVGQFIRRKGSDIKQGTVIAQNGDRLTALRIGGLAAQGITEVEVYAPRRILIVTGGAEIGHGNADRNPAADTAASKPDASNAASTSASNPATIPDANAPLITAAAKEYGIDVAGYVHTNDHPGQLKQDLDEAIAKHRPDAIVTSGGISHGKYEPIRQLFQGWFGHVAQQPGGPQGLSTYAGIPVISLPGNPISTLVSFRLYVAPILGHAPQPLKALLTADIQGLPDIDQFRRATLHFQDGQVLVTALEGTSSHLLLQAMHSTAFARIPAGQSLKQGQLVEVFPL